MVILVKFITFPQQFSVLIFSNPIMFDLLSLESRLVYMYDCIRSFTIVIMEIKFWKYILFFCIIKETEPSTIMKIKFVLIRTRYIILKYSFTWSVAVCIPVAKFSYFIKTPDWSFPCFFTIQESNLTTFRHRDGHDRTNVVCK